MKHAQKKLTDFYKKYQPKAPPKKVLLKTGGIGGILAEQIDGGNINLLVEYRGVQKLIAILKGDQFKALMEIPLDDLSPYKLREIMPKVGKIDLLLLNEAMLKFHREKRDDLSATISSRW